MPSDDVIMILIEASAYQMLLRSHKSVELYWTRRWLLALKGRSRGKKRFHHYELRRAQMLVRMESEKMGVCKVSSSSRLDDLVHQCVFYD